MKFKDSLLFIVLFVLLTNEICAQWSTATLSIPRENLAAASVGTKVFFGGGNGSSTVDIYNNATNTWSTAILSQGRDELTAASVGTKVFFAGGHSFSTPSSVVDIYDNATNIESKLSLKCSASMECASAGASSGSLFM